LEATVEDLDMLINKAQESTQKQKLENAKALRNTTESIDTLEKTSGKKIGEYKELEAKIAEDEEKLRLTTLEANYSFYSRNLVKQSDLLHEISACNKDITRYNTHLTALRKGGACSECGQVIPKKDIDKQKRDYRHELAQVVKQGEAADIKLQVVAAQATAGKILQEQADTLEASLLKGRAEWKSKENDRLLIEGSKGRLQELRVKFKEIKAREITNLTPPLKQKKAITGVSLRKQQDILKKYKRKWELINWTITTPLSNSGIKAFLFDVLLEALNNRVEYYERFTNIGVILEINMDSARKDIDTIVTKDGYPVSYSDLSGGESQLVNTVMALAQNDILTKENPSNLSVLDEVFEGMDEEATELVGGLLQDLAKNKSVFVITHSDSFNPRNANLIRL